MILSTAALLGSAAVSALSAGASAYKRNQAREEEARNYQNAKDYLNSMYYRDPLSTAGNRSLLKAARQNYADNLDALNNRMVAGGATMENQLAAMKSANQGMDKLYGQLLMGEDARRDRIAAQKMQLENQHSAAVQSNYRQAAQDWSQWGNQTASAILSYGSTGLLDGAGAAANGLTNSQGAEAMGVAAKGLVNADMMKPIGAPSLTELPGAGLGGLRGPGIDLNQSALTADTRFPWTPD